MTDKIPDGFIPWSGGENPAVGRKCAVILRHKNTMTKCRPSHIWHWKHSATHPGGDIIAYRLDATVQK